MQVWLSVAGRVLTGQVGVQPRVHEARPGEPVQGGGREGGGTVLEGGEGLGV